MSTQIHKGFRELTELEKELIDEGKVLAEQVGVYIKKLREFPTNPLDEIKSNHIDGRWLSIGQTDLQKGFMAVTRSIAKPETF